MKKTATAQKAELKTAQAKAYHLQGVVQSLGKKLEVTTRDANENIQQLHARIGGLEYQKKGLTHDRTLLHKRCSWIQSAKCVLKNRLKEQLMQNSATFGMKKKHRYSTQMRSLTWIIVSAGAAEARVGETLVEIGKAFGVPIDKQVSRRSVGRFMLERGIAADIQLVYEILKSGIVDYSKPDEKPAWKLRTLGIGTSVNHSSEVQVRGLCQLLHELADIFNNSPLAKREDLRFEPNDFAYRLLGTSGDHAADQKKSHELLRIWRMEVILQRLGEEVLFKMEPAHVLAVLISLKAKQITAYGGQEMWDTLPIEEKEGADLRIIREIGQQVLDALPAEEQVKLTRFIRTGCCMHKDLNCVKGGTRAMGEMWTKKKKTPPITLASKDNAFILGHICDPTALTAAEKQAEEVSKRGGCHATMLDVSNTRYGSHGEAAATIIVYRNHFIEFMNFVRTAKDRPGQTNIEKNFSTALKDVPTLTELCVLALYNVAVSCPFMKHVRSNNNILLLEQFFKKKSDFLQSIILSPTLWTGNDNPHGGTRSLDGKEWDEWSMKVLNAIKNISPTLPDLDDAVVAFVEGTRETFVDRFSDEFKKGNGIDKLTEGERNQLYFSSTNDTNEGGLGSWRRGQVRRLAETLHKFNASFKATQNDTESFMSNKLTEEADHIYLIRSARKRNASGLQMQHKVEQMQADKAKAAENTQKEARWEERRDNRAAVLLETSQHLVLDDAEINKLNNNDLNRQLDYHRDAEKQLPSPAAEKVPLKSYMKYKEACKAELKKAVARYVSRNVATVTGRVPDSCIPMVLEDKSNNDANAQYLSDYNDDLV